MANIAYRSSTQNHASATTLAINVPAGVVNGDELVLIALNYNLNTLTTPAGWVSRGGQALNNNHGVQIYTRVAASEPGSYTLTWSANADNAAIMLAYSNPDAVTPYDTFVVGADVTSDTSAVQASITTANANEMLVLGIVYANNGTFTAPAGFNQRELVVTTSANRTYVACDSLQAVAGASGAKTATLGTAARSESVIIALNSSLITPTFWQNFIKCAEVDA